MKILVVEDVAMLRDLMLRILRDDGHDARGAEHALEAMALLMEDWKPDLCLVDYNLPGPPGTEFVRSARSFGLNARFIGMSNSCPEAEAEFAKLSTLFIQKPFTLKAFRAIVDRRLDSERRRA